MNGNLAPPLIRTACLQDWPGTGMPEVERLPRADRPGARVLAGLAPVGRFGWPGLAGRLGAGGVGTDDDVCGLRGRPD
jgi:hypothetical protein